MVYLRNKNDFETRLLLSQSLRFKAHEKYITAIFTHLLLKLYKNTNLQWSFKAAADAADKGRAKSGVCNHAALPDQIHITRLVHGSKPVADTC